MVAAWLKSRSHRLRHKPAPIFRHDALTLTGTGGGCRGSRHGSGGNAALFFAHSNFYEAAMAKPATVKIKLVSSADTGFYYVTKKNPRNITEKLTFRKYDPIARKHVEFKEAKIK
jgi:large subunit ribosomal protein L33